MSQKSRQKIVPVRPKGAVDAQPVAVPAPVPVSRLPHFFTKEDWFAAAATFFLSGFVFVFYVSPEVTLEDSGELVTGAFNFGVPHPPGYPLWAFLGWVWSHLFPFGNPALRLGWFSAFTGALLVGSMTLLMTRSILMLLRNTPWSAAIEEPMKHWIALTVGSCASLLLAFNRGVWLWACVPEMRVLSVCLFVLTTCLFFAWMMRPEQHSFLYATVLLFGLGITNHQTIAIMALPFLIGALTVSLSACLELVVAAAFSSMAGFLVLAWLQTTTLAEFLNQFWWWAAVWTGGAATMGLIVMGGRGWLDRRRALICTALFLAGCSFYLYMPLASATNPPMNWGYTATKQGFFHHISRGQYERLHFAPLFSPEFFRQAWAYFQGISGGKPAPPPEFFLQVTLFTRALLQQYTLVLTLFPLVTLALLLDLQGRGLWKPLATRGRCWLIFVWAAFLTASFGLMTIINPGLEKQQQEITIKFFAPAHAFYAMLIGYGIALAIGAALARWPALPRPAMRLGCVALLVLPIIPFARNYPICEQRNHDFGYQFGYRMFYPGGGYPPMEPKAVLYGGTDPGRFVPTYMIFCESRVKPADRFRDPNFDRSDVIIITQNALADSTYMSYIRDHYDLTRPKNDGWFQRLLGRDHTYPPDPIWIPSERDTQQAFQQYVTELQTRPHGPGENVQIEGGRVSVQGVEGVMAINAILTKMIFDRAKEKHAFYVEESYPIAWMYPYLEPAGIIMKLNKDPLPSPEQAPALWSQIVSRDRTYWDTLSAEFTPRPEFKRDGDAQKTFSKLRSAIGGVYASRHMTAEAEYAFKQALMLCPESPEANFRLTQLYMEQGRFNDALATLEALRQLDPYNSKIVQAIQQVQSVQQVTQSVQQFETLHNNEPRNVQYVIQLAQAYAKIGRMERIQPLLQSFLAQPGLGADDLLQVAQAFISLNQIDRSIATLQTMVTQFPQDSRGFYALAIVRAAQMATNEALDAIEKAVHISPQSRDQARTDARLNNLRNSPRFQRLISPSPTPEAP